MKTEPKPNVEFDNVFQDFIDQYPTYSDTQILDDLRETDYSRLDKLGHIYLDYTGGNLYAESQIEKHHELLKNNVFGNPHSTNPTSLAATQLVNEARAYVLKYFNAQDDYFCVFTANASNALKIVGECYPFCENSQFLLTYDNHNSVNGIREFAKHKECGFDYVPLYIENLRLDEKTLKEKLKSFDHKTNKLFALPAQSNVSGVKHPLTWIRYAQKRGWDVLLDAAAFVPSSPLNLKEVQPDFVSMSFYKIFGYPTGLGALFIKKSSFHKLQKPWFAGGTVNFVSVGESTFSLEESCARFEDGTINYLDIPAIKIGLEHIESIGIETIQNRVRIFTDYLIKTLLELKHSNGREVVTVFGPKNTTNRGGTIILNFCDENGKMIPWDYVEHLANEAKISLRTGCFCNPGLDEVYSCVSITETMKYFSQMNKGGFKEVIKYMGKLRGAVRISVGIATNFKDVYSFIQFAKQFVNMNASELEFGHYMSEH